MAGCCQTTYSLDWQLSVNNPTFTKGTVLRESVREVSYVYELRNWFVRNGGGEKTANAFTARALAELVEDSWATLATWGPDGTGEPLPTSIENIFHIVEYLQDTGPAYLIEVTEKGRHWVERYDSLLAELNSDWGKL